MVVVLIDTSAIVGYLDPDDALHSAAVEAIDGSLIGGARAAMSAVSWAELLHGAWLGHADEAHIRDFVADLSIAILPVDDVIAERAAMLQAAQRPPRRLRTPDALILATAEVREEIELVVGGDDRWPKVAGTSVDIWLLREDAE